MAADAVLMAGEHAPAIVDAVSAADVAVVHGDGAIVGTGIMSRSVLFLCYVIKTRFGKRVALLNHTADLENPELSRFAGRVYPLLDDVTYRDPVSAERCKDRWSGRYVPDSAFVYEPAPRALWLPVAGRKTYFDVWPDSAHFDPAQPYLCVGGSSIYSFDGEPWEAIQLFAGLAQALRKRYPGQVVLTASDIKDEMIFRPIAKRLGLPLVGLTTPVQQAVDIVGNADAYIGGRWHPSIFALRGGTPVVPISSKSFKINALMKLTGFDMPVFDAHLLDRETPRILDTLDSCLRGGAQLREHLRARAAEQARLAHENIDMLRKWHLEEQLEHTARVRM
jgi:hypothetical protein